MKKATFSVIILFFMFIVGCGKQTDMNVSTEENNSNISTEENNSNTYINYFQTGEMVYDDGLIFGNDTAQWLDFKTMEKTVLCTRPNCTHITSECTIHNLRTSQIRPLIMMEFSVSRICIPRGRTINRSDRDNGFLNFKHNSIQLSLPV